jgi:hypothetical protein
MAGLPSSERLPKLRPPATVGASLSPVTVSVTVCVTGMPEASVIVTS